MSNSSTPPPPQNGRESNDYWVRSQGWGRDGKEQIFFEIKKSGWTRPPQRWLGGVCAAIAKQSGWDVNIVRGVTVVLTLLFWFPVLLYGIGWLFIPNEENGVIEGERLFQGVFDSSQVGALIMLFLGIFNPVPYIFLFTATWYWTIGAIVALATLFVLYRVYQNQTITFSVAEFSQMKGTPPMPSPTPSDKSRDVPPSGSAPSPPPPPHGTTPPASPATGNTQKNSGGYPGPPRGPRSPYGYNYGPVPPQYESQPPNLAPAMSNTVGLLVLGGLAFLAAILLFVANYRGSGGAYLESAALGAAIALFIMGITLGVAALRGRRGGWFLAVSIISAVILIPTGFGSASSLRTLSQDCSIYGIVNEYVTYGTYDECLENSLNGDYSGLESSGDEYAHELYLDNAEFDYKLYYLYAEGSTAVIDLTDAPEDYTNELNINAYSSTITIKVSADQAIKLISEGTDSSLAIDDTSDAWGFPEHDSSQFYHEKSSPKFKSRQEGITINATLVDSELELEVIPVDKDSTTNLPQSESTTTPNTDKQMSGDSATTKDKDHD